MTTSRNEFMPWANLASHALRAAIDGGEPAEIAATVAQIAHEYGCDALPAVMIAWIDTMLHAVWADEPYAADAGIEWELEGSGVAQSANEVSRNVRWAGWLVAARTNRDNDQLRALINSVATDHEFTENIWAVLNVCSTTLRHAAAEVRP